MEHVQKKEREFGNKKMNKSESYTYYNFTILCLESLTQSDLHVGFEKR